MAAGIIQRELRGAKPERLAALTRLRAFLIAWVLVYHLELALRALGGFHVAEALALKGYLGVDGFFVLSGFALFLGYRHRAPVGLAGYAGFVRRRAERLFPLHLAALGALVLLVGAAMLAGFRVNEPQRFGAYELLMQALLLHAWETTAQHAWNYPSWALSAIWAGTLAFPLLLPLLAARGASGCWAIVAAAMAGLFWLGTLADGAQLNRTLHLGLVRFGLEFVLGLALARLVTLRAVPGGSAAAAVLLVPIGIWAGQDVVAVAGLVALVVRLGMEAPGRAAPRDLAWRLGEASFGIYLAWVFVEAALVVLLRVAEPGQGARIALMAGGLVASAALGWLAWRVVEVPAARRLSA
ncbi:acyltransferase family protein [Falsiroseomonas sp.]|uniref:acyltransferase family protein n=1 Tax=Falsiroseomonas sp. TaxID=2870721 RepID=UPI0034A3B3B5